MKHFEDKLQAQELRKPPAELRERVLKNAQVVDAGATRKNARLSGTLMILTSSKWFLFLILPLSCIGSIGALALAIEERGADRKWKEVEKLLSDAGESLDLESFFAPPVPDEENFMATPALKGVENSVSGLASDDPAMLRHGRFNVLPDLRPPSPSQAEGERLDLALWRILPPGADLDETETIGDLGGGPEETLLRLLDVDRALFEELALAAKRPFSQPATTVTHRLSGRSAWQLGVAHLGILQKLAQLTSLLAIVAARLGDRELAGESLGILFKCRDGAFADGTLISGLVGISIRATLEARLPDLLREECWTDDDLRWLQEKVAEGDGFDEGLRMFRAEMALIASAYD